MADATWLLHNRWWHQPWWLAHKRWSVSDGSDTTTDDEPMSDWDDEIPEVVRLKARKAKKSRKKSDDGEMELVEVEEEPVPRPQVIPPRMLAQVPKVVPPRVQKGVPPKVQPSKKAVIVLPSRKPGVYAMQSRAAAASHEQKTKAKVKVEMPRAKVRSHKKPIIVQKPTIITID